MATKADKTKIRLQKAPPRTLHAVRPLRTAQAMEQGKRAIDTMLIIKDSPWIWYNAIYKLRLGENKSVIVGERRGISFDLVDIRTFRALNNKQLEMLQTIQHPNFATVHEVFQDSEESHVAFEHMPRSLSEAVGNPYLDSSRLAAIVGQIVAALAYLEGRELHHGHLTCSQIYLHPSGKVKLGGQESCSNSGSSKDIRDLGYVMMELMEGYVKEGNNIGLDEPDRWHSDAISFLSETAVSNSATELLEHPFLRSRRAERLKGFVSIVMAWTRPEYEYLGWKSGE